MQILFDATAKVKPARRIRRFGAGLLSTGPVHKAEMTAADRDWAAYNLNADATDYDVLAALSETVDRMSAGYPIF